MSRARLLFLALVVCLLVPQGTVLASSGADAQKAESLGLACVPTTSSDGVRYQRCSGELPSFDSVGLDMDVSIPENASGPLPTILMLHGWSEDKSRWETDSKAGSGPDTYHWNNVWFVSKGYAVVNYTARGFKQSCGSTDTDPNCATTESWTHLSQREWETRDSQWILSRMVDAGLADPSKLAATGDSYGGGQSWLLATSLPWTTPNGRTISLAASVPLFGWSDILYSLAPNGRASDSKDQSASHEMPFGVPKASYVSGLYASGRAAGEGRYNTTEPSETHSYLDGDYARVNAGEPYDDPTIQAIEHSFEGKSAYYANDYFSVVASGDIKPVPIDTIQGWTDPLFPPVESIQMYRKLKAVDPSYPIYMGFGDVGHSNAQNPRYQWRYINGQGNQFLNTFVQGQGNSEPTSHVFGFETRCPAGDAPQPALQAATYDKLASGTITATSESPRTTTSANDDPSDGLATDPITHAGCMSEDSAQNAQHSWTWNVPGDGFTLLGLPKLHVDYTLAGTDATVALKLWDLATDGTKTLVTRGEYRLSALSGDGPAGRLSTELNGNGWDFEGSHRMELQISQTDAPYLRPDDLPSSMTFSNVELQIPIREGYNRTVVAP